MCNIQAKMSPVQTNPCYKMSFIGGVLNDQNERRQLYMVPRSCNTPSRGSRMIFVQDGITDWKVWKYGLTLYSSVFVTANNITI
jgi:hypothetical protein